MRQQLTTRLDRIIEIFQRNTQPENAHLPTRAEAVELQELAIQLYDLFNRHRAAFIEAARSLKANHGNVMDQACEKLTVVLEAFYLTDIENYQQPRAVNGVRTSLAPVPDQAPESSIVLELTQMLSGVSWDSPVPVALVNWFAWDLLVLFEAVVEITEQAPDATVALPQAVDAVFSACPAVIAVPPTIDDYVSLPPEAAAMACACLFYQASWSRQLSAGIEAVTMRDPRAVRTSSWTPGSEIQLARRIQDWHARRAEQLERELEAAWRRCGPSFCVPGSLGELISHAAAPWSLALHCHFPPGARARAVEVLRAGHLLTNRLDLGGGMMDLWVEMVMPLVLSRYVHSEPVVVSSDLSSWVGAKVLVHGLEEEQYNGRCATVLAESYAGRLTVRLAEIRPEDGDGRKKGLKMALHPVNLRRVYYC